MEILKRVPLKLVLPGATQRDSVWLRSQQASQQASFADCARWCRGGAPAVASGLVALMGFHPRTCRRRGPQTKAPRRAIMWDDEELEPLAEITQKVYLDVTSDRFQGRIVLGLYAATVPKAAENFRALCTGEKGFSYVGSCFHRIFWDFMAQGGKIEGHQSIYGGRFEDEQSGLDLYHERPGLLGMANDGPDSNGVVRWRACYFWRAAGGQRCHPPNREVRDTVWRSLGRD
ncbi:Peptidyl-prolyl cis-trans isomerase CYP20-3 [Durusdinium trenchii]|uniref:Peptidyl-prolyl cis-trans isomerase n=1 Tax=Durusdinium trenchii TaxID=1381693 RepID=A0ABP0M0J8_9DINO